MTDLPARSVVFHSPHPDGAGCGEPKPFALTAVLNALDGLHCPIAEAIADIRAAVPDADVRDGGDYIHVGLGRLMGFRSGSQCREFNYCAIKYMEAQ